jgi:hypothetical protein
MTNLSFIFPALMVGVLISVITGNNSCRNRESAGPKTPVVKSDKLSAGVWGGQHVAMEVTATGANLEFDCATSTIDEPIILNAEGKFEVKGKFSAQHGGPIRRDEETNSPAAHYVGHVAGNEMTLTITIADKKEPIGAFNLTKGSEGRLMKCR